MSKNAGKPNANGNGQLKVRSDLPESTVQNLTQVFKLLSDDTRLRIIMHLLRNEELHVTSLCQLLGQSQPAVSHHLALLRVSGVIESRREGKHNYYVVNVPFFSELLHKTFGAMGPIPKKLSLDKFVLNYLGA